MCRYFRAIALLIVFVGAFSATTTGGAQAAPQFTVSGAPVSGEPALANAVKFTSTTLKFEAPEIPFGFACTALSVNGGKLTGLATTSATSLALTGCTVSSNPKCQLKNVGGTFGTIKTEAVTTKLVTVASATDTLFSPAGTNFVELEIAKTELGTCPWSGKYKITGTAALQVTTGTSATYVTDIGSKAVQKAYNATPGAVNLSIGAKEAWLVGTVDVALASDSNWGVDS